MHNRTLPSPLELLSDALRCLTMDHGSGPDAEKSTNAAPGALETADEGVPVEAGCVPTRPLLGDCMPGGVEQRRGKGGCGRGESNEALL